MISPKPIGIVLAGGKSQRMKTNKALITYHQVPQFQYVAQILTPYCEKVLINGLQPSLSNDYQTFLDHTEYLNHGPLSGILTALTLFPGDSLFIHAIDYPFLSKDSINQLYTHFQLFNQSVCFKHPDTGFLEPLIAIYHANDLTHLLDFYKSGQFSVRRFLESINPVILDSASSQELLSVDEPL